MYSFKIFPLKSYQIEEKIKNFEGINKNLFYQIEWLKSLNQNQNKVKDYFYVEIFQQKKFFMVLFFQLENKFNLKMLTWLFMNEINFTIPFMINGYKDIKKDDFVNILNEIFDHFKVDLVFLNKNPNLINKETNPISFYKKFSIEKIPIINLSGIDWKEFYETKCSAKTRQTDRRKEKLLAQRGDLEFIIAEKAKDREEIFNFTLKNKKLFLKKRGHNSKEFEKIFSKLFNQIKNNSKYICSMLKFENQIISSIVGILDNNCFYYLIPCTSENEFLKYSPQNLLKNK